MLEWAIAILSVGFVTGVAGGCLLSGFLIGCGWGWVARGRHVAHLTREGSTS